MKYYSSSFTAKMASHQFVSLRTEQILMRKKLWIHPNGTTLPDLKKSYCVV